MRRSLLLAIGIWISTMFAAPALAQVVNPSPPGVMTGAATNVARATATVGGKVDANGAPTGYRIEYGTTTSYGLTTTERSAGDGDIPISISVKLSGLTAGTTYHFRVVATNSAGTERGVDRRLTTTRPPNPRPPVVTTGGVRDLVPRSATLTGSVNPRAQRTWYRFEYGVGTKLDRRTARVNLDAGTAVVPASAGVALAPNKRYSYRLLATNAAGATRGKVRRFASPRALAALTFAVQSSRVAYEGTAVITGNATSAGVGGVALVLERQPFPYIAAFDPIASQRSGSDGSYLFNVSPLLLSARFRVNARTVPPVTSVAHTVRTTVRVSMKAKRVGGRRVRFSGDIIPSLTSGRVSLQRRVRGRFVTLRRASVRHPDAERSTYRLTVSARRSAAVYRVRVTPERSSGHARGTSREQRIAGLRRR